MASIVCYQNVYFFLSILLFDIHPVPLQRQRRAYDWHHASFYPFTKCAECSMPSSHALDAENTETHS